MYLQLILSRNKSSLNDGGIAAILNLAMSRGRPSTNETFFAGETMSMRAPLGTCTTRKTCCSGRKNTQKGNPRGGVPF